MAAYMETSSSKDRGQVGWGRASWSSLGSIPELSCKHASCSPRTWLQTPLPTSWKTCNEYYFQASHASMMATSKLGPMLT